MTLPITRKLVDGVLVSSDGSTRLAPTAPASLSLLGIGAAGSGAPPIGMPAVVRAGSGGSGVFQTWTTCHLGSGGKGCGGLALNPTVGGAVSKQGHFLPQNEHRRQLMGQNRQRGQRRRQEHLGQRGGWWQRSPRGDESGGNSHKRRRISEAGRPGQLARRDQEDQEKQHKAKLRRIKYKEEQTIRTEKEERQKTKRG